MGSLDLISTKLTVESSQKQIKAIADLWREDHDYQDMQAWVSDAEAVQNLTGDQPNVTGAMVLDMPDDEAAEMQGDLTNVWVLRDEPIELIQPARNINSIKSTISDADLWHLEAIKLVEARQGGFNQTGKGVTIAVLDTGVEGNHSELRGKVVESYDFRQGIDPILPQDTNGHGTHVAGLISGNQVGVAPESRLINGMIMPNGVGDLSNFVTALNWAGSRADLQIVNISAGLRQYREILESVMESLMAVGILPICAVGNEGWRTSRSPGNCRDVISVGAISRDLTVTSFSGSQIVNDRQVPDLVAPGKDIYSAALDDRYESMSGTSMATPIVSGVAALILEKYPNITLLDLREELFQRCKPLADLPQRQGEGMINVLPIKKP
jgi:subtilisin family serine protease